MESLKVILFLCVFALWGCGQNFDRVLSSAAEREISTDSGNTDSELKTLKGSALNLDGTVLDLESLSDRPIVLMFAQEFCKPCKKEVKEIIHHLKDPTKAPSKVHLITILIDTYQEDAEDWKAKYKVPWQLGFEEENELFKKYCAKNTTPCTTVFTPEKGIVYNTIGQSSIEKLEALTGSWED